MSDLRCNSCYFGEHDRCQGSCACLVCAEEAGLKCPLCKSDAYLCDTTHTDGPGLRIHCREASLHNFTWPEYQQYLRDEGNRHD